MHTIDAWCVPSLAAYGNEFVVFDRCVAMSFERFDCLEFVTSINSLTIAETFDSKKSALAWFEFCHEFTPSLQLITRKPIPFENVRMVEVREVCGVV